MGFPGERERDHDTLLAFLAAARLDWAGFFPFSAEAGTAAVTMDGTVADGLMGERLRECSALQDPITRDARDALIGTEAEVLVDHVDDSEPGAEVLVGRTHREAPELDGVVHLAGAGFARPGAIVVAEVTGALGPDLEARALAPVSQP